MTQDIRQGFRTAGVTTEQLVMAGKCIVYGVHPELTTTGTITLRDAAATGGANVIHIAAIGLLQPGKTFSGGVLFQKGVTIQLSVASDLSLLVFEAL